MISIPKTKSMHCDKAGSYSPKKLGSPKKVRSPKKIALTKKAETNPKSLINLHSTTNEK
jgi:hypothetical protein